MSLSSARRRYLSALGTVLPSLVLVACKDPAQGPATADGATSASATASATATPIASDSTPRTLPPHFRGGSSCPSGTFCVAESAKLPSDAGAAPAPYARCGATATHPDDTRDSGYRVRRSVSFSAEDTATERTKDASACCYTWVIPCPGGRAFRDAAGTPSVARTTPRSDWSAAIGALATADLDGESRAAAAAHWTREAAFEHASIAAFAQLTLDLLYVGAPPDLLEATQRATLDEIEHARIAFALAEAYGGAPVGPAALSALPGASRTLATLARGTFIDACIGESIASAALAEASEGATDPVLRELLATMADDEERHAELAWRIVAWALRTGGEDVAAVLTVAKDDVVADLVLLPADGTRAMVLREVVLPCTLAMLRARAPSPAAASVRPHASSAALPPGATARG